MKFEPETNLDTSAVAAPDSEELVGAIINDSYRVESVIARGGWGFVVKARHLSLDRYVALKLLHPHLAWDSQKVARFKQEAQAASMLSHQNVLAVRDYGYWSGRPYLVMDFLGGHTLADEIKSNPTGLSTDRFLDVFEQVVSGVAAAHRADIVHRDITPANIFVIDEGPEKGSIKVLDFGLAKLVSPEGESLASLTQTGASLGTPAYMSPEQCKGEKIDARTDVYSLGCCMYEALSGKKVFEHDTVFGYMSSHVDKQPEPLLKQMGIGADLETLIMRCLEKDKDNRPQTVEAVLDALIALREGKKHPLAHRRSNTRRTPAMSRKLIVALALLAIAGSMVLLGPLLFGKVFEPQWQKEYTLSGAEYQNNNFQGAIFHQVKAVELAAHAKVSKLQMGELHYNLGVLYTRTRNWQAARETFHAALKEFEKDSRYEYLASVYGYLMLVEFESGHNDKAVQSAEKRVELVRKFAQKKKSLSDALQQLSDGYARVGNLPKAEEAVQEALEIDQSTKDQGRVYERLVRYGDMLDKLHRHEKAAKQYKEALTILDDQVTKDKLQKALTESKEHHDPK